MWEKDKRTIRLKPILLIALSAVFIPVSYVWYDALSNFTCKESISTTNYTNVNPTLDKRNNCPLETNFHWIAFYGINGLIYGMPLIVLVQRAKRARNL